MAVPVGTIPQRTSPFRADAGVRRQPRWGTAGFTLIELMIVLVIVGLGAAIVAPAIDSGMRMREVRSGVRALASSFRQMQSEAIRTGRTQTLLIDPEENEVVVEGTERRIALGEVVGLDEFQAVVIDASGVARVSFFPNGSNTGLSLVVADVDDPLTLGYLVRLDPLIGSVEVLDESPS